MSRWRRLCKWIRVKRLRWQHNTTWKPIMYLKDGSARSGGKYIGDGVWFTEGEEIDYTRIAGFDMYG